MKVVFILSSPHSGSTLVSLVLGMHSSSANLGEVSFIPKLLALEELCTCGERLRHCATWSPVFDGLRSRTGVDLRDRPYDLYLGDLIKPAWDSGRIDLAYQTRRRRIAARLRAAADRAALELPSWLGGPWTALPSIRTSVKNTLELYHEAAQAWEKDLIIDASKFARKAVRLHMERPDCVRVLHLVRDGRAVTTSRMKYMSAHKAMERWSHYNRLTIRLLNRWVSPEYRKLLRYEDFVRVPEVHLQELCDWLEIRFEPSMLRFAKDQKVHSAGGNPARFTISGGIKPPDERWRTSLTEQDLLAFKHIAGPLNEQLGYD